MSMQYISNTGVNKMDQIIDIGGGISTLVDDLLADGGYQHIHILDISAARRHNENSIYY